MVLIFRHVPPDRGPAAKIKPEEAWSPPRRLHSGQETIIVIIVIMIILIMIIITDQYLMMVSRFPGCWERSLHLEESTWSQASEAALRRQETPASLR